MNLIFEKSARVSYYTDMAATLAALNVQAEDYDWYISDVESNIPLPELCEQGQWLSGRELSRILKIEGLQFMWAVFSAVAPGLRLAVTNTPYADGNPNFWCGGDVVPQLSGALFEIVCWDSGATLLVGISAKQGAAFLAAYPDAKSLAPVASETKLSPQA